MKDVPVLFSPPMVRALLNTRIGSWPPEPIDHTKPCKVVTRRMSERWLKVKAGDRLWVKEGWRPSPVGCTTVAVRYLVDGSVRYFAGDGIPSEWRPPKAAEHGGVTSLFMPRWASRIQLEVLEDTRAERLQDITEDEARLEGCSTQEIADTEVDDIQISDVSPTVKGLARAFRGGHFTAKFEFLQLWYTLHTKPGERWEDNPTVYRVGPFKRIA